MSNAILELFSLPTQQADIDWESIIRQQQCPFLARSCVKVRKSQPQIAIGTCTVTHGAQGRAVVICPHRFLERRQVFVDCLHLLALHEPGNELHLIPEVAIPGGNVDYVLASTHNGHVVDFVGIELQAVDTTGTLWPRRQQLLESFGFITPADAQEARPYGMNWKMTAKTTLVQLHHKVTTFERLGRRLVLVLQDSLIEYMRSAFSFGHIQDARLGDAMHFHVYRLENEGTRFRIQLASRASTTADGVALCLGLQASPNLELKTLIDYLQSKVSVSTRFSL